MNYAQKIAAIVSLIVNHLAPAIESIIDLVSNWKKKEVTKNEEKESL